MRKNRVKLVTVFAITTALIGASIFYACKKDVFTDSGGIKSHKSMVYYDEALVERFMNEPLVCEFREYVNSLGIEKEYSILKFKDPCDANELYDKLIEYSQRWDKLLYENQAVYQEYIESERFPRDPMLFAFEVITNFHSLRAHIENQLLELEAGDGISMENNPDNHYVVSEYERTLFTPDGEIIAGNTIFMYGEYQDVYITDLDFEKLEQTKTLWRQYGETEGTVKAVQLLLAEPIPIHKANCDDCTAPCDQVKIEKKLTPTTVKCPRRYEFSGPGNFNVFGSRLCSMTGITWDFGDGTTVSNTTSVAHEYKQQGKYAVKLYVTFNNGATCVATTDVEIKDCDVSMSTPVKDNAYPGNGTKYIFQAEAKNCSGATPTYYWDFGDGITTTTTNSRIEHVYTSDGQKPVSVTVNFSDGCTATTSRVVLINVCCRYKNYDEKEDRYRDFTYNYSSYGYTPGYWVRHFFTTRQCAPFWHRIVVKDNFYNRNKKGNWNAKGAYKMHANFRGQVGYKQWICELVTIYPQGEWSYGKDHLTYDYAMHDPFWIGNKSIKSSFKIEMFQNGATDSRTDVIELHENPCNK